MACCAPTNGIPGTPTLSSGLTQQKVQDAARRDQARILATLRASNCGCPTPPNPRGAIYSSVLTQDKATSCQPSPVTQALTYPKQGVPESIRIQRLTTQALECSVNPVNPITRFSYLKPRGVVVPPCPGPTAEQLNSTTPKPTFWPGCQPTRFVW
jgi:hypothetical protein